MTLSIYKSATPNFHEGRWADWKTQVKWEGPIDMVTIHVTEGSAESVVNHFGSAKSEVSAHYMIRKTGQIDQFVDEENDAFVNGRVSNPVAALVKERRGVNPNAYTIGIEHEGDGTTDLTDAQRKSSIALIRDICTRRNITIDRRHIVGHREIFDQKTCPGAINVDLLVDQAARDSHPGSPDISIPRVVWSQFLGDYLVVVNRTSDAEWYYVPMRSLAGKGTRAGTPLSQFPLAQPK